MVMCMSTPTQAPEQKPTQATAPATAQTTVQVPATAQHVPVVQTTPPVEDKFMKEFTDTVQEMIRIASELAFDLATIECDNAGNCEVCVKARELVKLVKKLMKLAREHMGRR